MLLILPYIIDLTVCYKWCIFCVMKLSLFECFINRFKRHLGVNTLRNERRLMLCAEKQNFAEFSSLVSLSLPVNLVMDLFCIYITVVYMLGYLKLCKWDANICKCSCKLMQIMKMYAIYMYIMYLYVSLYTMQWTILVIFFKQFYLKDIMIFSR